MTFDREAFLRRFWQMDAALVAAGFPAISPWWRREIERFVRSGCRRWVIRAGRRAGKSTTLCRLAVAWAWFGQWSVPPGDIAVIPFVSVSKDEASARLRTIETILRTLGLKAAVRGDEIELKVRQVLFKPIACTTTAVVGFTSIAVFGDEVARWESGDSAANPAKEVAGSLMPTLATQPEGFAVWSSAPWSQDDFHATLFNAGDTALQVVSFAPTWIANPTVTEAMTHDDEPDEKVWAREYAATPGETITAALDAADVAACFGRPLAGQRGRAFVCIDPSSLRGDAFAYLVGRETDAGEIAVHEIGGWEAAEQRHLSMQDIVVQVCAKAQGAGTRVVYSDQREEASLRSLFAQHNVTLISYAWSEPSKDKAVMTLRRLMRERRVSIVEHAGMRRELAGMKARLMPSGRIRYETNGLDYASALITLCHAIDARAVLANRGAVHDRPATFTGGWQTNGWFS